MIQVKYYQAVNVIVVFYKMKKPVRINLTGPISENK